MGWKGKEADGTQSLRSYLGAEVPSGLQDGREGNLAQSPLVCITAEAGESQGERRDSSPQNYWDKGPQAPQTSILSCPKPTQPPKPSPLSEPVSAPTLSPPATRCPHG